MSGNELTAWLSWEEALEYSGRSPATLKRAVNAGKVNKRLVPAPGNRPRVYLSRDDLDAAFGATVHVPTVSQPDEPTRAIAKVHADVDRLAPVLTGLLAKIPAPLLKKAQPWLERQAVADKLCWTLREARVMTGLTEPALRELIARKPAITIKSGRRVWFKAEGLRKELS